jgi:hypothetical protein
MKTIVQEVPKERCSLRAQPFCEFETKLVPVLKPVDNCVDVPKEVCVRMRTNPRKVKRPVIKKWCYVPTEESGLNGDYDYGTDSDSTTGEVDYEDKEGSGDDDETVTTEITGTDSEDGVTEETPAEEEESESSNEEDANDSSQTSAKRK